jgi:L-alanine-DL-glutamate epimerase-like enolase superfamily enzyme
MYSIAQFRDYLQRGAASIVQPDVARIGGITPWLKVAHMAEAFNVVVCPHFLMELHVSLVAAVPNGRYVEHIPQLRAITTQEMEIVDGHALAPETPGLGIAWNRDALDDRRVA